MLNHSHELKCLQSLGMWICFWSRLVSFGPTTKMYDKLQNIPEASFSNLKKYQRKSFNINGYKQWTFHHDVITAKSSMVKLVKGYCVPWLLVNQTRNGVYKCAWTPVFPLLACILRSILIDNWNTLWHLIITASILKIANNIILTPMDMKKHTIFENDWSW